jgi:O-acetylserine/cysteine efflux transporter
MRNPRDSLLALTIVVIWGVNFVAIGSALDGYPPLLLAALRFALTALAAFVVPRPAGVRWYWIAAIGLVTFVGQYALLFTAMANGLPEGLASLILQSQAPFTLVFAALLLHERTGRRHLAGIAIAGAGLAVIGAGRGGAVPLTALLLAIGSAASWGLGNICTRKAGAPNGFAVLVWASLWAAPPLALLSLTVEGPHRVGHALAHPQLGAVAGLGYVVLLSTFVGLGGWVLLLGRHPAGAVAPYTLGVPPIGMLAAYLAHGERIGAAELAGAALVLAGLVAVVWGGTGRSRRKSPPPSAAPVTVRETVSAT